ncbi:MAG: hypothetical protein J6A01_12130 [Proteobacteria bacterium]|nr:hypothetical protein [Pseudomonadota bacterium]
MQTLWTPNTNIHTDDTFGHLAVCTTQIPGEFKLIYEDWETLIYPEQRNIQLIRQGSIPEFYFRERIALPFACLLKGNILLHAGALSTPNGMVLMLAPTGIGKSTITASALAFSSSKLATDDMIPIDSAAEPPHAIPLSHYIAMRHELFSSEPFVKNNIHILGKTILEVNPEICQSQPAPLAAIIILAKGNTPKLLQISNAEAIPYILNQQIILSNPPPEFKRTQFHALLNAIKDIPIYHLDITTHSKEDAKQTIDCLIQHHILPA